MTHGECSRAQTFTAGQIESTCENPETMSCVTGIYRSLRLQQYELCIQSRGDGGRRVLHAVGLLLSLYSASVRRYNNLFVSSSFPSGGRRKNRKAVCKIQHSKAGVYNCSHGMNDEQFEFVVIPIGWAAEELKCCEIPIKLWNAEHN